MQAKHKIYALAIIVFLTMAIIVNLTKPIDMDINQRAIACHNHIDLAVEAYLQVNQVEYSPEIYLAMQYYATHHTEVCLGFGLG